MISTPLDKKEVKDLKVLVRFTGIFCHCKHQEESFPFASRYPELARLNLQTVRLCRACQDFLDYAIERRVRCPLDPKPTCKHCQVHCYRSGHREKVREIMKFAGPYLIKRGRLDLLWHYFF